MNSVRACGSLRRKLIALCSSCDFGSLFCCHSCSQVALWYLPTTLLRDHVEDHFLTTRGADCNQCGCNQQQTDSLVHLVLLGMDFSVDRLNRRAVLA